MVRHLIPDAIPYFLKSWSVIPDAFSLSIRLSSILISLSLPKLPDPEKQLRKELLSKELASVLAGLQERERHVVQRFFGLGVESRTMAEIAAEMGLKRERVRQIRDHAVRKIMKQTRDANLKDYFKN